MGRVLILLVAVNLGFLSLTGCVTEAGHIRPVTLASGKQGYMVICNSDRYDRCLNRAARVCDGAYTILPQDRSTTFRPADRPGIGNGESILITCGQS
jgi:hypothetical protein